MPPADRNEQHAGAKAEGARVMTICNACRYCEQYCPVFQAMERRLTFASADLNYLANLCHNCGECLYACQYAPPHEFAINVPQTLARIRVQSYEQYAWPAALAGAFGRQGVVAALLLATVLACAMLAGALIARGTLMVDPAAGADFYAVVPHATMVAMARPPRRCPMKAYAQRNSSCDMPARVTKLPIRMNSGTTDSV